MTQKGGDGGKLGRWLGAPVRALSRACDSYVRRMSACAGRMPTQYAGAVGRGGFAPGAMQAATFSSRSRRGSRRGGGGVDGDDDVDELVRAMSWRQQQSAPARKVGGVPDVAGPVRSRSVAVGRIDENASCEFGTDAARVGSVLPPAVRRSRSVAVGGGALAARAAGFGATKKGGGIVHAG